MTETIICTIITAVAGIVGAYAAVQKGRREDAIKDAVREQKQADRLEAIERKLDTHNGYAEKLGVIGETLVAMKKDIEFLKGRTSYGIMVLTSLWGCHLNTERPPMGGFLVVL